MIEQLKKRGEKAAMILAMAELGDVHAHFGNWGGATTAWNDALDTLLGPYQVTPACGTCRGCVRLVCGLHGCACACAHAGTHL